MFIHKSFVQSDFYNINEQWNTVLLHVAGDLIQCLAFLQICLSM